MRCWTYGCWEETWVRGGGVCVVKDVRYGVCWGMEEAGELFKASLRMHAIGKLHTESSYSSG